MTTFLDVMALDKYVAGVVGRAGLRVVWDEPGTTPRTDNRTIWLPKLTSAASVDDATRLRYYVKHEASHCVHSDFDYLNEVRPWGALALLNNLFEDNRIDYLNDSEYIGDTVISNAYWTLYAKDIAAAPTELLEKRRSVIAAFMLDALARTWIHESTLALSALNAQASADNLQQLDALLDKGYLDDLLGLRYLHGREAAEACMALAKKVFAVLFPEASVDDHIETPSKAPKTASESKSGDGEGVGSGKDGKGSVAYSDEEDRLVIVDVQLPVEHEHAPSRTGKHLVHEVTKGAYSVPLPKQYVVVNLPNTAPFELFLGYFRSTEVTNNIVENGKPMANKLRIKLQTRSRGRYEYGQKRGKLHGGSLHRVLQDSPVSERVFRQHKVVDTLDTAVMVLVDCSGSMSGEKFEMACVGAGSVVEALRPLHIECSVLGFTNNAVDGSDDPVIFNFKKYGEQITTSELVSRFNIASGYLWENTDGDAIVYAYHQLMQRKEKRKVLLVLSDGSPSGRGKAGDIVAYTKLVTDTIYNSNTVDMYGIGIMDSDVKKYYKKNVVVYKLSELSYNMLSIIDRSLT